MSVDGFRRQWGRLGAGDRCVNGPQSSYTGTGDQWALQVSQSPFHAVTDGVVSTEM